MFYTFFYFKNLIEEKIITKLFAHVYKDEKTPLTKIELSIAFLFSFYISLHPEKDEFIEKFKKEFKNYI